MSDKSVEQIENKAGTSTNARRSFIKKGAAGAALITTISSKSAWAASCSCSGNLSNNASAQAFQETCTQYFGYSQGAWGGNGKGDAIRVANFMSNYYDSTPGFYYDSMTVEELFFNNSYLQTVTLTDSQLKDFYKNKKAPKDVDDEDLAQHVKNLSVKEIQAKSSDFTGVWRQRITAALNATVWAIILSESYNNPNSDICTQVAPWFYYPLTLSYIVGASGEELSGYHSHPDNSYADGSYTD